MSDPIDLAQEAEERHRAAALRRHQMRAVYNEPPDPGVCVACGDPIASGRLAAFPVARRCIECQQDLEREARRRGLDRKMEERGR